MKDEPVRTPIQLLLVALLSGLTLAACESRSVKLQREMADLRTQRTEKLDALYASYGGGDLSGHVVKDTREEAERLAAEAKAEEDAPDATDRDHDGKRLASKVLSAVGNVAEEMDRAAFEAHCMTLGRGHRPTIVTDKARRFFATFGPRARCREIADLAVRIDDVQRRLDALQAGTSSTTE